MLGVPATQPPSDDDPFTARNVHLWAEDEAGATSTRGKPPAPAPAMATLSEPAAAAPQVGADKQHQSFDTFRLRMQIDLEEDDDGNPITSRINLWSEVKPEGQTG